MRSINRTYVKIILPVIFVLYVCSTTLFQHKHVVGGVVIVHSHPYKSTGSEDGGGHTHTHHEFCSIFQLSHFETTTFIMGNCLSGKPDILLYQLILPYEEHFIQAPAPYHFQLRAPPSPIFC